MHTRLSILSHVLDIIKILSDMQENLRDDYINSVGTLVNLDQTDLVQIPNIKVGHIQSLLPFKTWFAKYLKENGNIPEDWMDTFIEDA